MRALQLTGVQKLETVDITEPVPDGHHVLMRVSACGICGSDLHYWEHGVGLDGVSGLIPGHEFCGTIVDPGSRPDLASGDRVTALPLDPCDKCGPCRAGQVNLCLNALRQRIPGNNAQGAFSEYLLLRPDMVRKLPDAINDRAATLVEPAAVALHAIHQVTVHTGDSVLVVGGGAIGRLAAKWARIAGASRVALAEINTHRRDLALATGDVDAVFDPIETGVQRRMKELTGGGFDVAIDTSATSGGINTAVKALHWRGRLVLAGIALKPQKLLTSIQVFKELTITAAMGYLPREFDHTIAYMANQRLNAEELITKTLGFDDCQAAFEGLFSGQSDAVKIIVQP